MRIALPNDPGLVGAPAYPAGAVADPNGALLGIAAVADGLWIVVGR